MSQALIPREKTAIKRVRCSKPIGLALVDGVITSNTTVLDYGCGHGTDVRYLRSRHIDAVGWDPHFAPDGDRRPSTVVNLSYVLNVVEDSAERHRTFERALTLARSALVVAVRVDRTLDGAGAEPCGDGFLTGRGTFQKVYSHDEFRSYVEAISGRRMYTAALGIGYVFTHAQAEQRYLANKAFTRRLEYRTDLVAAFEKDPVARRLIRLANRLGRVPLEEEFGDYARLQEAYGSRERVERLLLGRVNKEAYEGSRAERRNDILVYLAMLRLQGIKPPPYTALPAPVQSDLKAVWGSYARALEDARQFLFSLGNPEAVRVACAASVVGKLLPGDLYVHRSAEDETPALLRVVVFAARRIVGELEYDVVKIALDGRSVSFLSYKNFEEMAHPTLARSVRVYLPKASFDVRDYSQSPNPPILHRKDALVLPTHSRYDEFRRLTEEEERQGLLSGDIGYLVAWEALLSSKGLFIDAHRVHTVKLDAAP